MHVLRGLRQPLIMIAPAVAVAVAVAVVVAAVWRAAQGGSLMPKLGLVAGGLLLDRS